MGRNRWTLLILRDLLLGPKSKGRPPADVNLTLDVHTLFALVGGHTTVPEAIARGAVQCAGSESRLAALHNH